MPDFLVIARDGLDPEAPSRRSAARAAHLARIAPMVAAGELMFGGATLDESGRATASVFVIAAADRPALEAWIAADPYRTNGVWVAVEIELFKAGVSGGRIHP